MPSPVVKCQVTMRSHAKNWHIFRRPKWPTKKLSRFWVLPLSWQLHKQEIPCVYRIQTSLQCSSKPLLNLTLKYNQFTPSYHPFPRSTVILSSHLYPDLSSSPFLNDFSNYLNCQKNSETYTVVNKKVTACFQKVLLQGDCYMGRSDMAVAHDHQCLIILHA